jgi:hypothetical protein
MDQPRAILPRAVILPTAAIHAELWMGPSLEQHDRLPGHGFWFTTPDLEIEDVFFSTYGVRFGTVA